jgi:hypothetical protein
MNGGMESQHFNGNKSSKWLRRRKGQFQLQLISGMESDVLPTSTPLFWFLVTIPRISPVLLLLMLKLFLRPLNHLVYMWTIFFGGNLPTARPA